jgi:hypothetical protein
MNDLAEGISRRPGCLREIGDRLSRGGVRALLQRLFRSVRLTGDRLTRGGLRSLATKMATKSLRVAISQTFLKALGRGVLHPFPSFSARVYRLATRPEIMPATAEYASATPHIMATAADAAATTQISPQQHRDHSPLVNSFYKTAFGHIVEPDGLAACSHQLDLGVSLEELAEQIGTSVEFLTRHGPNRRVDTKYLTSLHRDGLRRQPDPQSLGCCLMNDSKTEKNAR